MFDQMKAMGAIAGLMRDKDKLAEISKRAQDTLEMVRVVGEAGGGAVRVTVSGKLEVQDVELDPNLTQGMAAGDDSRVMAQNLIAEAVNDANARARVVIQREMQKLAEELGLPEIPGMNNLLGAPG
jgi:nucleoid-associated protein EbfC